MSFQNLKYDTTLVNLKYLAVESVVSCPTALKATTTTAAAATTTTTPINAAVAAKRQNYNSNQYDV